MVNFTVNHNICLNHQPVVIQNTFVMSFFDNFSQWKKLDTKNQWAKHTKMNFPTVYRKIRKKSYVDIHLFYQETVNRCFSNKILTQIKPLLSELFIWKLNTWLQDKWSFIYK